MGTDSSVHVEEYRTFEAVELGTEKSVPIARVLSGQYVMSTY